MLQHERVDACLVRDERGDAAVRGEAGAAEDGLGGVYVLDGGEGELSRHRPLGLANLASGEDDRNAWGRGELQRLAVVCDDRHVLARDVLDHGERGGARVDEDRVAVLHEARRFLGDASLREDCRGADGAAEGVYELNGAVQPANQALLDQEVKVAPYGERRNPELLRKFRHLGVASSAQRLDNLGTPTLDKAS